MFSRWRVMQWEIVVGVERVVEKKASSSAWGDVVLVAWMGE